MPNNKIFEENKRLKNLTVNVLLFFRAWPFTMVGNPRRFYWNDSNMDLGTGTPLKTYLSGSDTIEGL